jgi:hypothetical protein
MKLPHTYFIYQLSFKLTRPSIQILITKIAKTVKDWNGVTTGVHMMGAMEFLIQQKEFGHIHWNGDLDILFGKPLTAELLKLNLVQRHKFVPEIAITYPLGNSDSISFAILLLRFSYLVHLKKQSADNPAVVARTQNELETFSFYQGIKHLL